jgi:hypothetical protein
VDTPEGEWYRVVAVDPQRNLLVVDDGIELPLSGDGALVLARDLST